MTHNLEHDTMGLLLALSQTMKTVPLHEVVELWPRIAHISSDSRPHLLILAAGVGRNDLVEFLLPFANDEDRHKAFENSAQRKHLNTLKLFIGQVDPNGNDGQALAWAISNKDYPIIDYLLQIVNPHDALVKTQSAWGHTAEWVYVNEYKKSVACAKKIHQALDGVDGAFRGRKM